MRERTLLSGSSYKRILISTKITAEQAQSIIQEFEQSKLIEQVKKAS
jgi:hypothetical protein